MELIIVVPIVAILILIVVGGLFVGRSRSRDSSTAIRGSGGGTSTLDPPRPDSPAESDTTVDDRPSVDPGDPDDSLVVYPGGPDLIITDEVEESLTLAQRFRLRLSLASGAFGTNLRSIFSSGLDDDAWEELEDALIGADVGVEATMELVAGLRDRVAAEGIKDGDGALALLKEILRLELGTADRSMARRIEGPTVWLFTGVNGTGKTTSIGKLAKRHADAGESVVLAAADTFRAAASEQLEVWGDRSGARVVSQDEGADPAAVAFDGWRAAAAAMQTCS